VALGEHCLAGFCQGGVDGISVGHGTVELLGERSGRLIGDVELHGDGGDHPLLDEALRDADEGVVLGCPGALAGVEDHQTKGTLVVQEGAQLVAPQRAPTARLVFEHQQPVLGAPIKFAMTDEVEDMVAGSPEAPLQGVEAGPLHPLQGYKPAPLEVPQGLAQLGPLVLDEQLRVVGRT
jgi:hypothetical protein